VLVRGRSGRLGRHQQPLAARLAHHRRGGRLRGQLGGQPGRHQAAQEVRLQSRVQGSSHHRFAIIFTFKFYVSSRIFRECVIIEQLVFLFRILAWRPRLNYDRNMLQICLNVE